MVFEINRLPMTACGQTKRNNQEIITALNSLTARAYVAEIPTGGIPGRTGTTVHHDDCDIYEIDALSALTPAGFTADVYNLMLVDAAEGEFVPIVKDAFDDWIACGAPIDFTQFDELPDQAGHAGEFLTTNGSVVSWVAGTGSTVNVSESDGSPAATAATEIKFTTGGPTAPTVNGFGVSFAGTVATITNLPREANTVAGGGASQSGVVTTGTQHFEGVKTFEDNIIVEGTVTSTDGTDNSVQLDGTGNSIYFSSVTPNNYVQIFSDHTLTDLSVLGTSANWTLSAHTFGVWRAGPTFSGGIDAANVDATQLATKKLQFLGGLLVGYA